MSDALEYSGHRQRVKKKFLHSNHEVFEDYELLELLLFNLLPRRDVKPLAKGLLKEFGSLKALINSDLLRLSQFPGTSTSMYIMFAVIREILRRNLMDDKIKKENVLSSWGALVDYLKMHMGDNQVEQFRVLFLNKKNILIADEVQSYGTVDQTAVYPREIIRRSLFHAAVAIILVHNHPSGNPEPSKADIEMTKTIVQACAPFEILVHDHVIIGNHKIFSFKSNMLL